jgi:thioester reductase-like protein
LDKAFLRLQNNLKSYGLWQQEWTSRLIPVRGDLAKPQLGLEEHLYGELASNIDEIYHNGATLSYVLPYSQMRDINVLGTREILSFACDSKVKAIHHISSVAVVESTAYYGKKIVESDPICHWESIYLGYSQTKWVSEQMVMRAAQRGIPVTIHRPPLISGHSKTGNWNTSGFLCRSLKGYIDLGYIMEDLDLFLDISPVDYVSKAIVYLSRQPNSLGKAFHLQHPQPLHWKDFVDILCQWGYPLKKVSYEEWQAKLMQQKNNTLYSLIPFFTQKWSDKQLTYLELNQQSFRPEISCKETLKALANSSIVCPLLDANLFDIYRNFLVKVDYIPPSRIEQ